LFYPFPRCSGILGQAPSVAVLSRAFRIVDGNMAKNPETKEINTPTITVMTASPVV